ncbi:chemotaxis protein [Paenibacillus yonginensis]|uniref:Chemotaxis protein n=1 Tax=Paenibacillus yonginensis TaxID=1462996 RepID=A0A1B1N1J2_9BACL|nr:methyl-accepting chemotaxis protein [Paenibacillus yonginensis]ANS75304.1 chemotaxis protein [Paenibacillus yonginensis]
MLQQTLVDESILGVLKRNFAIIRFNTDRKVTYVNEVFAKVMGYSVEEIENMQHSDFCFESFVKSPAYEQFWRLLLAGEGFQNKVERKNAHGESVWLEATYMPIFDEQESKVVGVIKIASDSTKRQCSLSTVVNEVMSSSKDLNDHAEKGISQSRELLLSVDRIAEISEHNTVTIKELKEQTKSIQGIVQTIRDIASQTNLLSLNAAIEAAHAGPYGKGFEVVASEVRMLSNQVSNSITEVQGTISGITKEISEISDGISRIQSSIVESQHQIRVTMDRFDSVVLHAQKLDEQAHKAAEML